MDLLYFLNVIHRKPFISNSETFLLFFLYYSGLTYLGDPVSIPSLPRGALVYSTDHMTKDDNQFSVEIVSLGEALDESGKFSLF